MTSKRRPTVGDRVRLLSVCSCHTEKGLHVGQIHTIDIDDESGVPYLIGGEWFKEEMVELVDDDDDQHAPGAKLDAGKPRVALVLAKALSDLIDQNSNEGRLLKLLIEELNDH